MSIQTTERCGAPFPIQAIPLGAMLLATSISSWSQNAVSISTTLNEVQVVEQAEPKEVEAKSSLRAIDSTIGKGNQALRDIPQSITVMTEMLLDDRNLDDFRDVLRSTAGVTFQAGETGEEDVRLRGFSLGQAGDIYVDGMRDAPLIERDTFNMDRVEVLKGSASMLFGKGSTGGVVNQVSKQPFLMDQSEVDLTVGTGEEIRLTGDFNIKTDDGAALRINAMTHDADNNGATVEKRGIAPTYRWGMGEKNEFSVGLHHLETDGRPLYNHPWFMSDGTRGTLQPSLPADRYYGLASDHLTSESTYVNLSHTHRFDKDTELKTTLRHGQYERDLLASVVRFETTQGKTTNASSLNNQTIITRTPKGRVGESDLSQVQSDLSHRFEAMGMKHQLLAGVDLSLEGAKRNQNFAGPASGLNTTVGTPDDGARNPKSRGTPQFNTFETQSAGLYAQDTVRINEQVQLVGGLRYDHFDARYNTFATSQTSPDGVTTRIPAASKDIKDGLWSPRVGAIFQPNDTTSLYASMGTSYNTSGDTYQYGLGSFAPGSNNEKLANTPPEKSRNFEVGGKFELMNQKATLGVALFHSEKFNERNTDSDSASTQYLLSGKRHATGVELNFSGQMNPNWEIFYNHTWIPEAQIDRSNVSAYVRNMEGQLVANNAQQQGDRPALTPKHSASLWTTYRVTTQWRVGGGLNHRGAQNPDGARHVTAPAFTTADAMVEYAVTPATTLKLNVTNLTDELYADSLYRGFYAPGQARKVQLNLKHLF
jgi:catecholate siderophore receptor